MSVLKRWLPVVAWSAIILLTSNDRFSSAHTDELLRSVFGYAPPEALNIALRKLAHLTGYGILGVLAFFAARVDLPRRPIIAALAVVVLVAGVDELHQSTLASRSGSGWDVVLDLIGASIAVWLSRRILTRHA